MASTIEGLIPFTYQGEQYHTWYKVYGNLEDRTRTPLICLHGGPGKLVVVSASQIVTFS